MIKHYADLRPRFRRKKPFSRPKQEGSAEMFSTNVPSLSTQSGHIAAQPLKSTIKKVFFKCRISVHFLIAPYF